MPGSSAIRSSTELYESRGGRPGLPVPNKPTVPADVKQHFISFNHSRPRAQELCESRGGRPGLPPLIIQPTVSVDVKQHFMSHSFLVALGPCCEWISFSPSSVFFPLPPFIVKRDIQPFFFLFFLFTPLIGKRSAFYILWGKNWNWYAEAAFFSRRLAAVGFCLCWITMP